MTGIIPASIHLGLCISYPSPGVIERIGKDWDWLWLDGQHGQIAGYDQMLAMVRACDLIQRPAFVRVANHEPGRIGQVLDMGAAAVIVPQVNNVAAAEILVRASKFPPLGDRSYGGRRPIDLFGREYVEKANNRTKLICQIESPEAVEDLAGILAVPGVDGVFLGPDDLLLRLGYPMSAPTAEARKILIETMKKVTDACRHAGKDCICVGVGAEMTKLCASLGANYIVGAAESSILAVGSRDASVASRSVLLEV